MDFLETLGFFLILLVLFIPIFKKTKDEVQKEEKKIDPSLRKDKKNLLKEFLTSLDIDLEEEELPKNPPPIPPPPPSSPTVKEHVSQLKEGCKEKFRFQNNIANYENKEGISTRHLKSSIEKRSSKDIVSERFQKGDFQEAYEKDKRTSTSSIRNKINFLDSKREAIIMYELFSSPVGLRTDKFSKW